MSDLTSEAPLHRGWSCGPDDPCAVAVRHVRELEAEVERLRDAIHGIATNPAERPMREALLDVLSGDSGPDG